MVLAANRPQFQTEPLPSSIDEIDNPVKNGNWRLYVTKRNGIVLGESTSRGRITQNCMHSFRSYGLELPSFPQAPGWIVIGSLGVLGHIREQMHQSAKVLRRRLKSAWTRPTER